MKLCLFGPNVEHNLIVMESESGRYPSVRSLRFQGGVHLIGDLVRGIVDHVIHTRIPPGSLQVIPSRCTLQLETFAECRKYPIEKNKDADVWRVDKLHGQTSVDMDYNIRSEEHTDLLFMEIPYSGGSVDKLNQFSIKGKMAKGGWAVVKTDTPDYIYSRLFREINTLSSNRHVVVMSLSTARKLPKAPVIGSLSWESIASGIQKALIAIPLPPVEQWHGALVVSTTNEGAAYLYHKEDDKEKHRL